jgi:hypothetical protein
MSGPSSSGGHSENLLRVDSAANLCALINQQIFMFSTPGDPFSLPTMNTIGSSLGSQIPSSQQGGGISSIPTGSASQGLLYDWNEVLQRTAGMVGVGGGINNFDVPGPSPTTISFCQLEQQLLRALTVQGQHLPMVLSLVSPSTSVGSLAQEEQAVHLKVSTRLSNMRGEF